MAIEARALTKVYDAKSIAGGGFIDRLLDRRQTPPGGRPAVDNVTLHIASGETVGILGVNGAGKTTLLSMLSGVLKPTSGSVRRSGRLLPLLGVGTSFLFELSGRENAEMSLIMMGVSRREARLRLPEIEAFADVGHHFDAPLWTYSSGMIARVAFASALSVDADTLVLDETLSVGDTAFRDKCTAALQKLQRQGRALLLVTHNPPLIAKMCTRGLVMDKGRLVFDGAPHEAIEAYNEIRAALDQRKTGARALEAPAASKRVEFSALKFELRRREDGALFGVISATLTAREAVARPAFGLTIRGTTGIVLAKFDPRPVPGLDVLEPGGNRTVEVSFPQLFLRDSYVGELVVSAHQSPEPQRDLEPIARHSFRFDVVAEEACEGQFGYLDLGMQIHSCATKIGS